MRRDKIAHDLCPSFDHFGLVQPLPQSEPLHDFRQHVGGGLKSIRARFASGETAPLSDNGGAKGGVHHFFLVHNLHR